MPYSPVHEQIKDVTRRFANEVIRPAAEALDRDERFPAEIFQQMGELGLFGITVPEASGGAGMDVLAYAVVMEELSRGYASIADQCGLVELAGTLLVAHGTHGTAAALPRQPAAGREARGLLHHRGRGRHRRLGHQDHRRAHRRRLAAERRQALDPQRTGCRLRVRAGPHRQGRRQARHEHLHRRSGVAGRVARRQGAQDGAARIPGRRAALRRRASCRPTRCSARRTAASTS